MKFKHALAILAILAVTACGGIVLHRPTQHCHSANGLPDPVCTPGVVRTTDKKIICNQGTGQFRPPSSYTNRLKIQQIKEYGYADINPADFEEDHLISLELGGDGYDPKNLWPEAHFGLHNSFEKGKIENLLHKRICDGTITPQEAQKEILNWTNVR
jgi:hypothetical protein